MISTLLQLLALIFYSNLNYSILFLIQCLQAYLILFFLILLAFLLPIMLLTMPLYFNINHTNSYIYSFLKLPFLIQLFCHIVFIKIMPLYCFNLLSFILCHVFLTLISLFLLRLLYSDLFKVTFFKHYFIFISYYCFIFYSFHQAYILIHHLFA